MINNKKYYLPLFIPLGIFPIILFFDGLGQFVYHLTNIRLVLFFTELKEVAFSNIPLLFAAVLPFFLVKKKNGIAMISGVISFVILTAILNPNTLANAFYKPIDQIDLSFSYINNILIGGLCGFLTTYTYNRFCNIHLPAYLSFFSGKRSVPIITSLCTMLLSFLLYYIWPILFHMFINFQNFLLQGNTFLNSIAVINNQIISTFSFQDTINKLFYLSYSKDFFYTISLIPISMFLLYYCWHYKNKYDYLFSGFIIITLLLNYNQTTVNILLLLFSPWLWILHCFCMGVSTLLPELSTSTYGFLFLSLYYLGVKYMIKKKWHSLPFFKDHVEPPSIDILYKLVHAMGDFENIKEIDVYDNQLTITVFDLEFVDIKTIRQLTEWTIHVESENKFYIISNINPYTLMKALTNLKVEEMKSLLI